MKKVIFKLITVMVVSALTGCATVGGSKVAADNGTQTLITPAIEGWMSGSDRDKFMALVNTAKPQQVETWENHDERKIYEFTSLKIYVNEKGQPCRIYRLRAASIWREHRMEGDACRISGDTWQGSSKEIQK